MVAHRRIETHSEGAEKRTFAHGAVVARLHMVCLNNIQRTVYIHRNGYMARKTVAGARRHYAESHRGVAERTGRFIHSAVASACEHSENSVFHSLAGKARGVSRACGVFGANIETSGAKTPFNMLCHSFFGRGARNRIYDKKQSVSHNVHTLQR